MVVCGFRYILPLRIQANDLPQPAADIAASFSTHDIGYGNRILQLIRSVTGPLALVL